MAFPNKNNGKNNHLGPKVFQATEGLDDFIKDLERYFFATAKLKCKQDVLNNRLDLVVELHFNFSISDCLRHFNNGDWSGYTITDESKSDVCMTMANALKNLNEKSTYPADIMETSLHFTDTSIVISRLYPNSIPEHLGKIISMINQHFIYFTKGLTEMPCEIFVPIFEDTSILSKQPSTSYKCGYYNYWGLYFFDKGQEHEALIYSLRKKKFYEENIFLFE
ncbi:MAG: hypothetical protein H2058_02815 [Muricauda sp.]|nr:hypothetical protein [Allomuricauda sp.]MBA4744165.1 hypothetical protein [Allomuricauda sp.]